ncbi:hypothetical protein HK102_006111 [Quaeritorhiza haematococci]|nr:hypothetical protein HK102_006111 [Quaeritorhiza haematococci]
MTTNQTEGGLSLREEFTKGQQLHDKLEDSDLPSIDPAYQEDVTKAIESLSRCAALVSALSLFSSNEIVEDINTTDLRYILVDALLGEVVLKQTGGDRLEILKKGQTHLEKFMRACDQHDILQKKDKEYYEAHIGGGEGSDSVVRKMDAQKQREEKVVRYKREKMTREKLKVSIAGRSDGE